MKKGFWKADWFVGIVVSLILLALGGTDLIRSLERKAYDLGVVASNRKPSDQIAVIAIDDASLQNIGRWPWPREIQAKMIEGLTAAGAKVIGSVVFYFEPQVDPGLKYIEQVRQLLIASTPKPDPANPDAPLSPAVIDPEFRIKIESVLKDADISLNQDRKLADVMGKTNNVLLPFMFVLGEPKGKPDQPLPEYVSRNQLPSVLKAADSVEPLSADQPQIPVAEIGSKATALGHLVGYRDVDGADRSFPLVVRYFDAYYPAFALMVAARSLNLGVKDIQVKLGDSVVLQNRRLPVDVDSVFFPFYYKAQDGRRAFQHDSFYDVFSGKIAKDKYKGKIVLIGPTAAGLGSAQVTPVDPAMTPVEVLAHQTSSVLESHYFISPGWGGWVSYGLFLLVAVYLSALLPRLSARNGAICTGGVFLILLVSHFVLMTMQGMWLQFMHVLVLLVVGHLLLTTKRYLVTERGKVKSDAESAESNRMLGLAFQQQGQLDMAFDKFRKCPMDDSMMDVLYNLALDFERKRQFNKAVSVFEFMNGYNPKFRDLEQKLARSKNLSETVILGGAGAGRTNSSIIGSGSSVEKPMLGRYQVEKELGKGAMGVVYLGKDPKISRVVAIKTMALSQEFEEDELQDAKERFFREAETAGRLNHPNIVTIFDAGEEHDLCYIAMEFLKGKDLVPYSKAGSLLPLPKVLKIVSQVSDALGYAHSQNVVHRDIKPANIMYEPESETVKVTDFGIARITDSSKTKTGMVLGTPSYMSPEQLSGKKIDGRSDLFSLGVMLYQMATGHLPFQGDSMAGLMYNIANEPHRPITDINPNLPPCVVMIVDKALAKTPETRYQTGYELAQAIKDCLGTIQG